MDEQFLSQFPKRTLKAVYEVFSETKDHAQEVNLLVIASSLAFTTILSIIPLLAVSFSIFQAFGGMNKLYATLEPFILSNLAHGSGEEVIQFIHKFLENTHVSAIGIGGITGLIFTSMSMLLSAERAINQIWHTKITRGLLQRISTYWLLITLGPIGLSIAIGVATSQQIPIWKILPNGTGFILISLGCFYSVFKWVPQTEVSKINAFIAAVFTTFFWNLAAYAYSVYTTKAVTYNVVYGSLGAIPIFMLWIDIGWIIVLLGTALTATLQRRKH